MKFWAVFIGTAFVCACSSTSKKQVLEPFSLPPVALELGSESDPVMIDGQLEKALRANPTDPMRFLVRYRQAKLWSKFDEAKACALWLGISENPRFPLFRVAQLRALETCPAEQQNLKAFEESLSQNQESWLREATARAGLSRAIRSKNKVLELRYSTDVAPLEIAQADQLKLLERAKVLANELGDVSAGERVLTLIQKLAPRQIQNPTPEQFFLVAADYRRARDYPKAREFYKKYFERNEVSDLDRLRALDGMRMTYKLESHTLKYLEATRDYSEFARNRFFKTKTNASPGKYLDTRLTLARAIWTENAPKKAEEILKKVETELHGRFPIEESLFLRARIEEEGGRLNKSVKILEGIDERRVSDLNVRQKIGWYRAWIYRKVGRMSDAAEHLQKLISIETSASLLARNHFWLGRTYRDLGQQDQAIAEFTWLTTNDPLGYYGTLAYRELGQELPSLVSEIPLEKESNSQLNTPSTATGIQLEIQTGASPNPGQQFALNPEEILVFEWLTATTELDLARRFLDQLSIVRRSSLSEAQLLDYLQLYARAGAYQSLFSRLSELAPEIRKQILDHKPELIFPRPWQSLVEKSGTRFEVKPELVYSIIRQESSFNPSARSPADAFGLMQLLPEVAQKIAPPIGLNVNSPEELFDPATNIMLGTAHLRELFQRWEGHFIPAVASYNASERAVANWLKSRDRKDPITFIEDIPYEETKGYVKLVLRNFVFYTRLSSNGKPISFPEWCLTGLQEVKL